MNWRSSCRLMSEEYECDRSSARADWREFAEDAADGAVLPPTDLLQAVAKAAGGLPENVKARASLLACAKLLKEMKRDGM